MKAMEQVHNMHIMDLKKQKNVTENEKFIAEMSNNVSSGKMTQLEIEKLLEKFDRDNKKRK